MNNVDIGKPKIFDGTSIEVMGFIGACKIYLKNKLREAILENQILWILSYV